MACPCSECRNTVCGWCLEWDAFLFTSHTLLYFQPIICSQTEFQSHLLQSVLKFLKIKTWWNMVTLKAIQKGYYSIPSHRLLCFLVFKVFHQFHFWGILSLTNWCSIFRFSLSLKDLSSLFTCLTPLHFINCFFLGLGCGMSLLEISPFLLDMQMHANLYTACKQSCRLWASLAFYHLTYCRSQPHFFQGSTKPDPLLALEMLKHKVLDPLPTTLNKRK